MCQNYLNMFHEYFMYIQGSQIVDVFSIWYCSPVYSQEKLDFFIDGVKAIDLFEDANKLPKKVKMELSVQEETFVRQSLTT